MVQALSSFTSDEILALGNAVGLWGNIAKTNMAYEKAVQFQICDVNGEIHQPAELQAAVDHIIGNSIDMGGV